MHTILATDHSPNRDVRNQEDRQKADIDVLRVFAEVCREDLRA